MDNDRIWMCLEFHMWPEKDRIFWAASQIAAMSDPARTAKDSAQHAIEIAEHIHNEIYK